MGLVVGGISHINKELDTVVLHRILNMFTVMSWCQELTAGILRTMKNLRIKCYTLIVLQKIKGYIIVRLRRAYN